MSVITYLYPSDLDALSIENLLPIARRKIEHLAISELALRQRTVPDWESLSFVHPSEPTATFMFVVGRKTKENVRELEECYAKSPNFSAVRSAKKSIWTQLKTPRQLPLKRFKQCWAKYTELIATVADVGGAIIESPENEKLFTPAAFRRHHRQHSQR